MNVASLRWNIRYNGLLIAENILEVDRWNVVKEYAKVNNIKLEYDVFEFQLIAWENKVD